MNLREKLASLNLTLPPAPKPAAIYVPLQRSGNQLFISGQLPMREGKVAFTGPVGSEVGLETAQEAAQQCALNALTLVDDAVGGDWSRLVRFVRLGVFVQSAPGFSEQHLVANGASNLLQQIFGDQGRHARAAVGVNALPLNASVEVEMIVEVA